MRIGGLASGMDTDSIVKDMMRVAKMPLDKLNQEKQRMQWQQEDFREINKSLFSFRDKLFDLKLQGTFQAKSASSSNDKVVTVTAGNAATTGNQEISISQLAKGAFKTSSAEISGYTSGQTLEEQFSSASWDGDKTGILVINGETISVDAINDSINDLVTKINAVESDTGVKASYDAINNRFFLSTTATGENAKIDFNGTDSNGLKLLGNDALKIDDSTVNGKNASLKLNGTDFEMAENKFTINGLNFDLKGISGTESPTTSIVITNDTDAVFEKIKDFVETYNELLEKVNGKTGEKKYRDFHPLSSEEKEELSDKEIELWEEKARSGTLRNDSTLRGLMNEMRMSASSYIETDSKYNSLRSIGIGTQNYFEGGKLHLDEDKLKKALNEDPQAVQNIFASQDEAGNAQGIGAKLYDVVNSGTKAVTEKAGRVSIQGVDDSFLGKRLKNMEKSIASWEKRLVKTENRYWSQFTAMEKALAQMNSQSDWLYQQFS